MFRETGDSSRIRMSTRGSSQKRFECISACRHVAERLTRIESREFFDNAASLRITQRVRERKTGISGINEKRARRKLAHYGRLKRSYSPVAQSSLMIEQVGKWSNSFPPPRLHSSIIHRV